MFKIFNDFWIKSSCLLDVDFACFLKRSKPENIPIPLWITVYPSGWEEHRNMKVKWKPSNKRLQKHLMLARSEPLLELSGARNTLIGSQQHQIGRVTSGGCGCPPGPVRAKASMSLTSKFHCFWFGYAFHGLPFLLHLLLFGGFDGVPQVPWGHQISFGFPPEPFP